MEDRYLFRGKRKDNGKWVEGYLVQPVESSYIVVPYKYSTIFGEESVIVEIDPLTICQCTGLKDKNGNLIWENDIIKFKAYNFERLKETTISQIKWCDDLCALSFVVNKYGDRSTLGNLKGFNQEAEVIGNIFDNPELLECKEIEEEYEKECDNH